MRSIGAFPRISRSIDMFRSLSYSILGRYGLLTSICLFDLVAGEVDVLRTIEELCIEFLAQPDPRRRGQVLVVLLQALDLHPFDILPARVLSALDRRTDAMHLVTDVVRKGSHQSVIAIAHPGFVVCRVDAGLESTDQKANWHHDSYPGNASAGVLDLISPTTLTLTRMAFPGKYAIGVSSASTMISGSGDR